MSRPPLPVPPEDRNLPARRSENIPAKLREAILEATKILDQALPPGISLTFEFRDRSHIRIKLPGEGLPKTVRSTGSRTVRVIVAASQIDIKTKTEQQMTAYATVLEKDGQLDLKLDLTDLTPSGLWNYWGE